MNDDSAKQYLEVYISNLTRHEEDDISGFLFTIEAMGVCENLQFVQPDVRFNPMVKASNDLKLIAYFPIEVAVQPLIEKIKSRFPHASVTVIKADTKDWLEEWKKGYEAFSLTGDIWIVPSWKEVPPQAKMPIFIDPGMAFGTGTHETTQICSQLIFEYMKEYPNVQTAFDVGTGTAILSILMSKLGVPKIYCSDIDPECKRVSLENLNNNKIDNVEWSDDFSQHPGEWDLIVANIIDGVLCDLKSDFRNRSHAKTQFIFSGILVERENEFVKHMLADWPIKIKKRFAMKDWVGYWFAPV